MGILKGKWPWMKRKEHYRILSQIHQQHAADTCTQEKRLDEEKKDLRQVIQNLTEVAMVRDYERDRWRIVLDVTREIAAAFERGNDERMIDHVVSAISYNLKAQIMRYNIMRPEDVGLGRPGTRQRGSVYDPGPWIEGSFYPDPKCEDKE